MDSILQDYFSHLRNLHAYHRNYGDSTEKALRVELPMRGTMVLMRLSNYLVEEQADAVGSLVA